MKKKITILNYGTGNFFSIENSLKFLGFKPSLSLDKKTVSKSDIIILPGVGSFDFAIKKLKRKSIDNVLKKKGKSQKIIGICLGMQLLFNSSTEDGYNEGLGLINGDIEKIKKDIKTPNIGWNKITTDNHLFKEFNNKKFYFLHSYYVKNIKKKNCIASSKTQNLTIPSVVYTKDNIFGFQFHPEKSSTDGLEILKKTILL